MNDKNMANIHNSIDPSKTKTVSFINSLRFESKSLRNLHKDSFPDNYEKKFNVGGWSQGNKGGYDNFNNILDQKDKPLETIESRKLLNLKVKTDFKCLSAENVLYRSAILLIQPCRGY